MADKGVELPRRYHKEKKAKPNKAVERLLGAAGFALLSTAAGMKLGAGSENVNEPPSVQTPITPEATDTPIVERIKTVKDKLNEILSLKIKDPKRKDLERQYAESAKTLEEIDQGFWVVADVNNRDLLMTKRHELRQKGLEGLKPLPIEKIKWAEANKIHPEALAISEDAYPKALEILTRLQQSGVFKKGKDASRMLISPGGMGTLTREETASFRLVGEYVAIEGLHEAREIEALNDIANYLSSLTGLNFAPNNIIGAANGDIGFQMRPSTAKEILNDFRVIKADFNIFDLVSSTVGAYIYLASRGYDSQDPQLIAKAITGWNQAMGAEGKIASLDTSYQKVFTQAANKQATLQ